MILNNIKYVDKNFELKNGSICISDGKFVTEDNEDGKKYDMAGLTALPGFIDIHSHGGNGADACDATEDAMITLSNHYANHGVTSFCPTTMTFPNDRLVKIFSAIENYKGKERGAYIQKINMEGPYISREKCGAQSAEFIRNANVEEFKELNKISKIALVDVAPETEGAFDFAREVAKNVTVSIAHTNATYEQAVEATINGFSHVTHFFNAMTPFTSRNPGVVGAVLENNHVTAELICDGYHLSPATLRIAFKVLGDDRCVVISDSMSSAGKPDGIYSLGGQTVYVKNGKANLSDGTIAGSTTNMFDEFLNLISFGIPFASALKACTINPAKVIKADSYCGSIEIGKNADLILIDNENNIKHVIIKGKFYK